MRGIKIRAVDPKEFEDAGDFDKTSIKGEMRKLYPKINEKLKSRGWTASDVVAWFKTQDIHMTVSLFRIYLWEIDREHGYKRSTDEYVDSVAVKKTNTKITIQAERKTEVAPKFEGKPKELGSNDRSKNDESQGVKFGDKPKTFEHDPSPDKDNLL